MTQVANQTGNQIAVTEKNIAESVLARINQFQHDNQLRLPKDYSAENALKSAWLILQETKDSQNNMVLQSCSRESIANALLDMVIQGLSPVKKQCYFIAYAGKLVLQRSYMGTVALAKRIAGVKSVVANAVYQDDKFEYEVNGETGVKKIKIHVQTLDSIDDTKIKGAYAIVTLENGEVLAEVMSFKQIQQAWLQGKAKGNSGAHNNFAGEMAKKSVISRALKLLINSSDDSELYDEIEVVDARVENIKHEIHENANKEPLDIDHEVIDQVKKEAEENQSGENNSTNVEDTEGPGF